MCESTSANTQSCLCVCEWVSRCVCVCKLISQYLFDSCKCMLNFIRHCLAIWVCVCECSSLYKHSSLCSFVDIYRNSNMYFLEWIYYGIKWNTCWLYTNALCVYTYIAIGANEIICYFFFTAAVSINTSHVLLIVSVSLPDVWVYADRICSVLLLLTFHTIYKCVPGLLSPRDQVLLSTAVDKLCLILCLFINIYIWKKCWPVQSLWRSIVIT